MRISDWSSDVCSSDLRGVRGLLQMREVGELAFDPVAAPGFGVGVAGLAFGGTVGAVLDDVGDGVAQLHADRQSVVDGKSVSVRVDPGGPLIIKKNSNTPRIHQI